MSDHVNKNLRYHLDPMPAQPHFLHIEAIARRQPTALQYPLLNGEGFLRRDRDGFRAFRIGGVEAHGVVVEDAEGAWSRCHISGDIFHGFEYRSLYRSVRYRTAQNILELDNTANKFPIP